MKLVRKITMKRVKTLQQFQQISDKFDEMKASGELRGVCKLQSISKLNFHVVISYINITEKVDYAKIFPQDHQLVNLEVLLKEQKKLLDYLNKREQGYPKIFDKLGAMHQVVGCYLVATTKKKAQSVSTKNTLNTIAVKIELGSLPREVNDMCREFSKNCEPALAKQQEEFDNFMKLSFGESDVVLQNILKNTPAPPTIFNSPESNPFHWTEKKSAKMGTGVRLEDVANDNVENINDTEFLRELLRIAEHKENYELCVTIRDRIRLISPI